MAERLQAQTKKDTSLFIPKVNVEVGTSDASIIDARKRLLLKMNAERNEELEAYLQQRWNDTLTLLPAKVIESFSKKPSQDIYEEHYYECMMKLFDKTSDNNPMKSQLQPAAPENVQSDNNPMKSQLQSATPENVQSDNSPM